MVSLWLWGRCLCFVYRFFFYVGGEHHALFMVCLWLGGAMFMVCLWLFGGGAMIRLRFVYGLGGGVYELFMVCLEVCGSVYGRPCVAVHISANALS